MIITAELVLADVKPMVFWGDNAPALFTKKGEELVERLKLIGQKYGYSLSLVNTNTELHGLPQQRIRSFYFFWKSPTVPLLPWKNTPAPTLHEHLQKIPSWASLQDEFVHKGKASELYKPYKYLLLVEKKTHRQFSNKIGRGTVANYLSKNGLLKGCIRWLRKHHKKDTFSNTGKKSKTHIQTLKHVKRKLAKGKGFWDVSIKFMGKAFTGVIKKNIKYAVHPTLDRFFSIRELMHIMGMPHDFQLENLKNINHICQKCTSYDSKGLC